MTGDALGWRVLDVLVYLIAGLGVGVLLAVVAGRGELPRIPDTPAELLTS